MSAEPLRKAKALIDAPEKWRQGGGNSSDKTHCALTAVASIDSPFNYGLISDSVEALCKSFGHNGRNWSALAQYNDTHTHAEVMALFDKAIALEEERELASG